MATTTIADYQVLRDGNFTLARLPTFDTTFPQGETFQFHVPSDLHLTTATSKKAVLAFKMRPNVETNLEIRINHVKILDSTFDASHTRAYWESFSLKTVLNDGPEAANTIPVSFFCAGGKIVISDVVLWYQINR